mmetsp:Transcript_17625/g.30356  ORF Transcript_17625/g.30356 Transcript_17625/m.30356 type:complete len:296 (-) Transcript_17625:77-964(-)
MDGPDELFSLRNNFYLGSYQLAINEGGNIHPKNESLRIERDCFVYRSYIALENYKVVLDEIRDNAPTALQSVRLLATYLSSDENKEIALITLKEWLSDSISQNNPTLQIIAAIIYCHERTYEEALRAIHNATTLEMQALLIQVYLRMDRVDLAERQLKVMQQQEDDATLTQLATAYVGIATGGQKIQEAYTILQELSEKYTSTLMLLNGMAVCQMAMGKFDEAEKTLLEAMQKGVNNPETLMNTIACMHHLRKAPEVINRTINQVKNMLPLHPWTTNLISIEKSFDRCALKYSPA